MNPEVLDPRELIRQAFFAARASGKKPDWFQMTAGVLKNRLLKVTSGGFDERDYGAASFTDFLRAFPDLVDVDTLERPPRVVLKEYATANTSESQDGPRGRRPRIRADLWRAIIDYSSGIQYVWDINAKRARPRNQATAEDLPLIPTLTPDELRQWRRGFLESHPLALAVQDPAESAQLKTWLDRNLSTEALLPVLRAAWNQELSHAVERKLREWFTEFKLESPPDSFQEPATVTQIGTEVGDLRNLALEVVAHMTAEELKGLSFPSEAVLRALRRRG